MDSPRPSKRRRSRSPSPSRHPSYSYRSRSSPRRDSHNPSRPSTRTDPSGPKWSHKAQMLTNQIQEDERMRAYVAGEDDFVLKQAKKKAQIRVREGRAKPIDWLAVTLRVIEDTEDEVGFDDAAEEEVEVVDPESVFDPMDERELGELGRDIEAYVKLETRRGNREYWKTMGVICKDRIRRAKRLGPEGRVVESVAADIDRLLGPKTYEELEALEKQIRAKLDGDEPIDTDYWGQLLDSLLVWKAKATLKKVYAAVLEKKMQGLRRENAGEAERARAELAYKIGQREVQGVEYEKRLDPEPMLAIPAKDKHLEVVAETTFLKSITASRQRIMRMGYVPLPKHTLTTTSTALPSLSSNAPADSTTLAFDKLVARGVDEDEEIFSTEEPTNNTFTLHPTPAGSKLRKPLYFNRVQLGYDWNKYNQTHYDADNPPPRVVQGYKFHIFYPDLIPPSDPTAPGFGKPVKAPSYKITRENGRKKGESLAAAGEEDMCIIRFSAGPPYEDVAFRIVDRDWDYSGKEGRGFKSVFEKGVLTLWFSFKKVYYRK